MYGAYKYAAYGRYNESEKRHEEHMITFIIMQMVWNSLSRTYISDAMCLEIWAGAPDSHSQTVGVPTMLMLFVYRVTKSLMHICITFFFLAMHSDTTHPIKILTFLRFGMLLVKTQDKPRSVKTTR